MPTQHHYVEDQPNHSGQPVRRRFSKRKMKGEWYVHVRWFVDGTPIDDSFYQLDTDEGRRLLAQHAVSPDMLREE